MQTIEQFGNLAAAPRRRIGSAAPEPPAAAPADAPPALELTPSHPSWPARFRIEAEVLRVALASLSPVLEHVGSTAVDGLDAIPVIDIALGLSATTALDAHAGRLANFGYRLLDAPEARAAGRRVLLRSVRGICTHRVHVVTAFGDGWHALLTFRDALRHDADLSRRYGTLKRELLRQTRGRPLQYAAGKADFIRSVLDRAALDAAAT